MTWRLAGSLIQLRAQVDAAWPDRSKTSDGTIGDAAHAASTSDHNPDEFGVVRAIDLTEDLEVGLSMNAVTEAVRQSHDPRVKYVIHEGRMFSSYPTSLYPAWTWRPYVGLNDHAKHGHFSVVADLTVGDDPSPWTLATLEDDMWQYITIDSQLVEHAFAQGWILPNTTAAQTYWLAKLTNLADPEWEDFKRAVTNSLVRTSSVTAVALASAVAVHAAKPSDKDGVHMHGHSVIITQDIAGTAI